MKEALREHQVGLTAYCLMPNHFHLLVITGQCPIGLAMHQLLTRYSLFFNRVYGRVGHLFQDRFKAIECKNDAYLINLVSYIHLNPVRAGLVARVGDWPWSSHREYETDKADVVDLSRLAEVAGFDPKELRDRYMERFEPAVTAASNVPSLSALIERAAEAVGLTREQILSGHRGGAHTKAKRLLVDWVVSAGYTLTELARALGCSESALRQLRTG